MVGFEGEFNKNRDKMLKDNECSMVRCEAVAVNAPPAGVEDSRITDSSYEEDIVAQSREQVLQPMVKVTLTG